MTQLRCRIGLTRLCAPAACICSSVLLLPSFLSAESAASRTTVVVGMAQEPDVLGRFSVRPEEIRPKLLETCALDDANQL